MSVHIFLDGKRSDRLLAQTTSLIPDEEKNFHAFLFLFVCLSTLKQENMNHLVSLPTGRREVHKMTWPRVKFMNLLYILPTSSQFPSFCFIQNQLFIWYQEGNLTTCDISLWHNLTFPPFLYLFLSFFLSFFFNRQVLSGLLHTFILYPLRPCSIVQPGTYSASVEHNKEARHYQTDM